ncbi:hypothetical protein F1880_000922 [Penicillium rolfsii]|nr:hypothetical protein F1880_000922 [Penicillium rolfsii]
MYWRAARRALLAASFVELRLLEQRGVQDILSSLPAPQLAQDSVPLLLVTPSFAHWVDPSHDFLPQLLHKLFDSESKANKIYAVAAIVDKISYPTTPVKGSQLGDRQSTGLNKLESEGLSLLVVDKESIQGKAVPPRRFGGPANEEPDLLVSVQDSQGTLGSSLAIGLRLANTVFVNGKDSTLFGMQWTRDATSNAYTLNNTIDLTSCAIACTPSTRVSPNLTLPLYPVGERRKVIASMGNILRQISKSSDPNLNESIPASADLEKDLPRYIKEHNIMDQRVSVWALVESQHIKPADNNLPMQDYLVQSLRQGGKLHRVVSGGGGWGKKQGLLSLDPEVSFSGTTQREALVGLDQLFNSTAEAELGLPPFLEKALVGEDLSLLSQVATAGDFIQFFVSVDPSSTYSAAASDFSPSDGHITYHFGVVSNAEKVASLESMDEADDITTVPNSFGALSEKAIAYTQPVAQNGETSESSSTKLDIPGSRVVLRSPFFGALGCTSAIVFTCFGAAYGTAKAGVGVCSMGVLRPDLIVKNIVPIVMAGIIGIYGLVVSVLVANDLTQKLPLYTGFIQLGAGLAVGLAGLAAGFAIGIVGDAGVRGTAQQPRLYVGMILILIFAEVLGLYGLIVALLMNSRSRAEC